MMKQYMKNKSLFLQKNAFKIAECFQESTSFKSIGIPSCNVPGFILM